MLIELEKEKHREEIKLAIGSQQEETKAISEDCCRLFNTEKEEEKISPLTHVYDKNDVFVITDMTIIMAMFLSFQTPLKEMTK